MAADPVSIGFGLPFEEQIDFFRAKLNLPTERWDDIKKQANDRAFIVAGAANADLLQDLRNAVDKAIAEGKGIAEFRKDFKRIVKARGWTGWTGQGTKEGEAWRTRIIYTTNLSTSYAAGRWKQLTDPEFLKLYPIWEYVHNDSVTYPRPIHVSWNGITLPAVHVFWLSHFTPNGWGCQCYIVPRRAGTPLKYPPAGWDTVDPKTGEYVGIDKGFGYAPGANATKSWQFFLDSKLLKLDAPIGAEMMRVLNPVLLKERAQAFAEFVDEVLKSPTPGKVPFVVGALQPEWVSVASENGYAPLSANITVFDSDIWHTFRDAKKSALDIGWYKSLPIKVTQPTIVVLDVSNPKLPAFLLFYDDVESGKKLVLQINYNVKNRGVYNVIVSGKELDLQSAQIGKKIEDGKYVLIQGEL